LLKRLPEYLSENLGVEIAPGSPTSRLSLKEDATDEVETASVEQGPVFLPALAAALDDGKGVNLLPANIRGALRLRAARGVIAPAALGVVALLILFYIMALTAKSSTEREFAKIQQQLLDLDQWRAKSTSMETQFAALTAELQDRQADFDSIKIGEPDIPRYLKAISNLAPENIYLDRIETKFLTENEDELEASKSKQATPELFSFESMMSTFTKSFGDPLASDREKTAQAPPVKRPIYGRVMEMSGAIYPHGTMTDVQLVDFVFSLENSGHFRDVAVDSMAVESSGKVNFRILCGL